MCRQCRNLVPCRIIEEGGAVYQERLCPSCGSSRARIADSIDWYSRVSRFPVLCRPSRLPGGPVRHGCPHDCGPCAFHANACRLPVFSITNACNMACPICFTYNRTDQLYFMSRPELARLLDHVIVRSGSRLVGFLIPPRPIGSWLFVPHGFDPQSHQ
jgi:7,8-dihydro-6-hydroxymethylpterin dimethyltransferase